MKFYLDEAGTFSPDYGAGTRLMIRNDKGDIVSSLTYTDSVPRDEWQAEVETLNKLSMYKTAFDPIRGVYVRIVRLFFQDWGFPVLEVENGGNSEVVEPSRLCRYCL